MALEERIKKMTSYMLAFRRIQDQSAADLLISLKGLTLPQLNVLNSIGDRESCTMGEIAKQVQLSLSSVTLIVDKLTQAKLVTRIRSKTDRRVVHAKLTAAGQKIYHIQIEHLHALARKMLSVLTAVEQDLLLQVMLKLTALPA